MLLYLLGDDEAPSAHLRLGLFAADLCADWPLVQAGVATTHLATVLVLVAVNQTTFFLLTSMYLAYRFHY